MQDLEIIELCKKGNPAAQKALFDRYASRLFMLCLRYCPDRFAAEELISDAFVKAFRSLHRFEHREKVL